MIISELKNNTVVQSQIKVDFDQHFDLIVIGAGTAGAISAVIAAENNLRVCCIEKLNMTGGTATAGGVPCYYYGLTGGRFEEIDQKANKLRENQFTEGFHFHADLKGAVLEQEIIQSGGQILFESSVIGVYLANDKKTVKGVRAITPKGVKNLGCQFLFDATGNGDICAMSGCEYTEGRKSDGKTQPFSSVRTFINNGTLSLANFDAGYIKCSDAKDMTRGIIHANSLHTKPVEEKQPPLYSISLVPGLREGRLITCDETYTFSDYMHQKPLKGRTLAYAYSNFDSHSQDWALFEELDRDWMVCASLWGKNFAVPISLGMMLPKNYNNLAVIGRALSVDHLMASLIRMQPCLQKQAEIVARATVLAIKTGVNLRSINQDLLEQQLKDSGCLNETTTIVDCSFPKNEDKLKKLLFSTKPGEAIWATSRDINTYRPLLLECYNSVNSNAKSNAAIAFGVAGDNSCIDELRDIITRRDNFIPESSRSHNQPRILAAIDLLGRLGTKKDFELLSSLMVQEKSNTQIFTHCYRSLLEIGDKLPYVRIKITELIEKLFNKEKFDCLLLMKNSSNSGEQVYESLNNSLLKLATPHLEHWKRDKS